MLRRSTVQVGDLATAGSSRALERIDRTAPKLGSSAARIGDLGSLGRSRPLEPLERIERPQSLPELATVAVASVLLASIAVPITQRDMEVGPAVSPQPEGQHPPVVDVGQPEVVQPILPERNAVVPPRVAEHPVGPSISEQVPSPPHDGALSDSPRVMAPLAATLPPAQDVRVDRDPATRPADAPLTPPMIGTLGGFPAIQAVLVQPTLAAPVPPGPAKQAWAPEPIRRPRGRPIVEVPRPPDLAAASEHTASVTSLPRLGRGRLTTGTVVRPSPSKASLRTGRGPRLPEKAAAPWTMPPALAPSN